MDGEKCTENSSVEILDKTLSCSVCLGRYSKPKVLPCSHVFCLHCLESIIQQTVRPNGPFSIICPLCRETCVAKGSDSLPTSLLVESLLEISDFESSKRDEVAERVQCGNCHYEVDSNTTQWCKQCAMYICPECLHHHSKWKSNSDHEVFSVNSAELKRSVSNLKQLMISMPKTESIAIVPIKADPGSFCKSHKMPFSKFCNSCKQYICLICSECEHTCSKVNDTLEIIELVNKKSSYLKESLRILVNQKNTLTQQAEVVREEIHIKTAEIISRLEEKERKLVSEVDRALHLKHAVLDGQIREVEAELHELTKCSSNVVHLAKLDTALPYKLGKFHSTKRQVFRQVANTVSGIEGKVFTPLEKTNFEFVPSSQSIPADLHVGIVKGVVCIASSVEIIFSTNKRRENSVQKHQQERMYTSFMLKFNDKFIRLPLCVLHCVSDKNSTKLKIIESPQKPMKYSVITNKNSTYSIFIAGCKCRDQLMT